MLLNKIKRYREYNMSFNKLLKLILRKWKKDAKVIGLIQFDYDQYKNKGLLTIYTTKPEKFIGESGKLLDKYKDILQRRIWDFKEVKFVKVDCIYYN